MNGRIHSIETFGSVDGPGIRFLIFLQGCNMRCRYCHNVDTWKLESDTLRDADSLLDQAERYRSYWRDKGGITVSGGEALLQIDFLIELFSKAKQRGINTCLDTAGQPFTREGIWFEKFQKLMEVTDLVILDIKQIDDEKHKQLTGYTNRNILDCARYLNEIHKPVWISYVLVPGITSDDTDLCRTREFLDTLDNIENVRILPYHTLGRYKWDQLHIPYTLDGVNPPTEKELEHAKKILIA